MPTWQCFKGLGSKPSVIHMALDVELEGGVLMVRVGGGRPIDCGKCSRSTVVDKGIDKAHRIFRRDVIIQDLGQEQRLAPITSSNVVHAGVGACQTNTVFATTTSSGKE